eukprot:555734_1
MEIIKISFEIICIRFIIATKTFLKIYLNGKSLKMDALDCLNNQHIINEPCQPLLSSISPSRCYFFYYKILYYIFIYGNIMDHIYLYLLIISNCILRINKQFYIIFHLFMVDSKCIYIYLFKEIRRIILILYCEKIYMDFEVKGCMDFYENL